MELQQLCASTGIQLQHSIPYTPRQNDVAERKNRSLKEKVACLLEEIYIPPYMWVEAINCSSYTKNRVPHNSVIGATPFEALTRHKPNVSHMIVFGSKAWTEIPTDKKKAFQSQSSERILLGYLDDIR